jgi:hypothetical protein
VSLCPKKIRKRKVQILYFKVSAQWWLCYCHYLRTGRYYKSLLGSCLVLHLLCCYDCCCGGGGDVCTLELVVVQRILLKSMLLLLRLLQLLESFSYGSFLGDYLSQYYL